MACVLVENDTYLSILSSGWKSACICPYKGLHNYASKTGWQV